MTATTPYEALVESAARLAGVELLADIDATFASTTAELLSQNQDALKSARQVLGPACVVPVRCEESFLTEHCDHFIHLRNLARILQAEARLAASGNEFPRAAEIALEILELANAVRRGGLMTDLLVSVAISGIAIKSLRQIRTKIDSITSRRVVDELLRLEAQREPFEVIVARDRDWETAVGHVDAPCDYETLEMNGLEESGLSEEEQQEMRQLLQQIADLPKSDQQTMQRDQDFRSLASWRLLAIDLALRAFHTKTESFPHDLSSLTPEPFADLPLDPFTESLFIYRRASAASFDLYSTGPKRFDSGGRFGPWPTVAAGRADLCLDADDYL